MKSGKVSLNLESFAGKSKEEFLKETKGMNIDHASVWKEVEKLNPVKNAGTKKDRTNTAEANEGVKTRGNDAGAVQGKKFSGSDS